MATLVATMTFFFDMANECYDLNGLSKTHFISKNTIQSFVPQFSQPLQTLHLVLTELATDQCGWLTLDVGKGLEREMVP
jgi:hypothetical protein